MHNIVLKQLVELGVKVITDDNIEGLEEDYVGEPKTFITSKGVEIVADIVLQCAGGRPNVPFPADEAVDEKTMGLTINNAMICEKLGTDATMPVWAVGDCTMYGGRGADHPNRMCTNEHGSFFRGETVSIYHLFLDLESRGSATTSNATTSRRWVGWKIIDPQCIACHFIGTAPEKRLEPPSLSIILLLPALIFLA